MYNADVPVHTSRFGEIVPTPPNVCPNDDFGQYLVWQVECLGLAALHWDVMDCSSWHCNLIGSIVYMWKHRPSFWHALSTFPMNDSPFQWKWNQPSTKQDLWACPHCWQVVDLYREDYQERIQRWLSDTLTIQSPWSRILIPTWYPSRFLWEIKLQLAWSYRDETWQDPVLGDARVSNFPWWLTKRLDWLEVTLFLILRQQCQL